MSSPTPRTSPATRPSHLARLLLSALLLAVPAVTEAQEIPTPEAFFGHVMGADRELADWDQLSEYYRLLDRESDRLQVVEMGPSTWGNDFQVLLVSSPENLARLDELQATNALLSDPRGASPGDVDRAVENGVVVMAQSFGLHSNEVAATQTAAELAYDMATRDDPVMIEILDNTLSVLFPSLNPDGTNRITEWYREWVGTEYEGSAIPWLYHPYIGHNNNRDAFMQNTVESVYAAHFLFREWVPQAYIDHHEMGGTSARFYIPPYAEPIRPDGDPLVWREMNWYGAHMGYRLEEEGHSGVTSYSLYSGWGHFGFHWITPFHNIAGMLTESARTGRLATPVYLHDDQLQGNRRQLESYEPQVNFPNPWSGGWWRVRNIVEQQKLSAVAALEIAAQNREMVLRNAWRKAQNQIDRGTAAEPITAGVDGPVAGYIIPADQHDPLTARTMVHRLLLQGVDVQEVDESFVHRGRSYEAGSWYVTMAQPKRGVVRWLLDRTFYPDNHFTRNDDGSPIRPYDLATHTMMEFMGVRVDRTPTHLQVPMTRVDWALDAQGRIAVDPGEVTVGSAGYVVDGRQNAAFLAVNHLFDEGIEVRRVDDPGATDLRAGDFLLDTDAPAAVLERVAAETGVDFHPVDDLPTTGVHPTERLRVAMYHRYWGGSMDEGWTRMMLEDFGFPYDSILDPGMTESNLTQKHDVVILPNDPAEVMMGPDPSDFGTGNNIPPEFQSGFGEAGVEALEAFVRNGGTLVTFAQAGELPIEHFPLPVRDVLDGLSSEDYWDPGVTLRTHVNSSHPAAYGMPEQALVLFGFQQGNNQAYEVLVHDRNERVDRVVEFHDRDLMQSGWLLGEEHLAGKAAMVSVRHGEGTVVLIGFRPQHRLQTHGTLKFIFNSLVSGPEPVNGPG